MEGWVDGWASVLGRKGIQIHAEMGIYFTVSLVKAVIDEDVAASQASRLAKGQGTS